MSTTPEGKVKAAIDALLTKYKIYSAAKVGAFPADAVGWVFKPVQGSAFGVSGIPDYLGFYRGYGWAVEAKAHGKKPTGFQKLQIDAISCSGGTVFVVDGPETLKIFEEWLKKIQKSQVQLGKEPSPEEVAQSMQDDALSFYEAREQLREKAYGGKPPGGYASWGDYWKSY